MNERIRELAREAAGGFLSFSEDGFRLSEKEALKFAELIVRECVNTLEFHGFDDTVPYIKWMTTNKLGVKND